MPKAEEQKKKTKEFSPNDNVEEKTSNTPETIKDDSQIKRMSFTERIAASFTERIASRVKMNYPSILELFYSLVTQF